MAKQIYTLTESELRRMIKEAINEIIPVGGFYSQKIASDAIRKDWENGDGLAGISFGVKKGRMNKEKALKYALDAETLGQKIILISNELERRFKILQSVNQQQINEGGRGAGLRTLFKVGRNVAKPAVKGAKTIAPKVIGYAGGASLTVYFLGIPQKVSETIAKLKNPDALTVSDVAATFEEFVISLKLICEDLKKYPGILGADVITQELQELENGPKDPYEGEPLFTERDIRQAVWFAGSIGMAFAGPVGLVYDALDIAGGLASAKAEADEEVLKIVAAQRNYLYSAIGKINKILYQSKANSIKSANQQIAAKTQNIQRAQSAQNVRHLQGGGGLR